MGPERRTGERRRGWRRVPVWVRWLIAGLVVVAGAEQVALRRYARMGVVVFHGDPLRRAVALTFDDGPNEPYTGRLLAVLRKHHARATFFVVGKNALDDPEAVRAVAEAGHAIANHSFSHADLLLETEGGVRAQITRTQAAIRAATGRCPALFRPPFGFEDAGVLRAARAEGLHVVGWSVSSKDWLRPGVDAIADRVIRGVRPGAIILLHDGNECHGGDRGQTVQAVERIVPALQALGYELVTVPELLDLPAEAPCPAR